MSREVNELDMQIAERVMGFQWFHCVAGTGVERNQFCSKDQLETWRGVGWTMTPIAMPPPEEFSDASGCPLYSTNISAAMEVVDKLRADGWDFKLWTVAGLTWGVKFLFVPEDGESRVCIASGNSRERAICLAALKTVNGGLKG